MENQGFFCDMYALTCFEAPKFLIWNYHSTESQSTCHTGEFPEKISLIDSQANHAPLS